jgi:hypothetical protein
MDLNREYFMRIKKLQKQRESPKPPQQPTHHLYWKLGHQLTDGLPFERAVVHYAGMVFAVAEHPGFADRTVRHWRAKQIR